jgi:hypothetical protein
VQTEEVVKIKAVQPLRVSSKGHGNRIFRRSNGSGFPEVTVKIEKYSGKKVVTIIQPKKEYKHISTGDIVKVILTKDRKHTKAGTYVVRVKTPTEKGVEVKIDGHRVTLSSMQGVKPVHRADGYGYEFTPINSKLLQKSVI